MNGLYPAWASASACNEMPLAGIASAGCVLPHWISVGSAPPNRRWPSSRTVMRHCSRPSGVGREACSTSPQSSPSARAITRCRPRSSDTSQTTMTDRPSAS